MPTRNETGTDNEAKRLEKLFKPANLPIVQRKSYVELDMEEVLRDKQRKSLMKPGLKKFMKQVLATSQINVSSLGGNDYEDSRTTIKQPQAASRLNKSVSYAQSPLLSYCGIAPRKTKHQRSHHKVDFQSLERMTNVTLMSQPMLHSYETPPTELSHEQQKLQLDNGNVVQTLLQTAEDSYYKARISSVQDEEHVDSPCEGSQSPIAIDVGAKTQSIDSQIN